MKIKKVILTNYRGYRNPTEIDFNNLTVFVGRNDVDKSTVLEALDLFFNEGKGPVKFDKADIISAGRRSGSAKKTSGISPRNPSPMS